MNGAPGVPPWPRSLGGVRRALPPRVGAPVPRCPEAPGVPQRPRAPPGVHVHSELYISKHVPDYTRHEGISKITRVSSKPPMRRLHHPGGGAGPQAGADRPHAVQDPGLHLVDQAGPSIDFDFLRRPGGGGSPALRWHVSSGREGLPLNRLMHAPALLCSGAPAQKDLLNPEFLTLKP